MEEGNYSCGILIDLSSKAFNTVNHHILLGKLERYGICGIAKDWFAFYLYNREQFVSIGNIHVVSHKRPISCGVPQGSVLGPLLFLIYLNDITNCSNLFDFYMFADDTNLLYSDKSLKTLESKINTHLVHVDTWLTCNKLSLTCNIDT